MTNQLLDAVYRGDGCDGNLRNLRSREADRLAVAVVEDEVLGSEVNVQANDAVPPQRDKSPGGEPAKQPHVRHEYVGVARVGPPSVLLYPDPERRLPVDRLPRLEDNPSGHRGDARSRFTAGELDRQGPGVVVRLGAFAREALLDKHRGLPFRSHISAPPLLTWLSTACPTAPTRARSSCVIDRAPSTAC